MRRMTVALVGVLLLGRAVAVAAAPADVGSASFGDGVAAMLGGSGVVTIEDSKRPRTLMVFGVAKAGFGAVPSDTATLDATYGYADGTLYPASITATGALDNFEIAFRTSAGARIRARTTSPTELQGTFEFKGEKKAVVLKRPPVTAAARRDSKITLIYIGALN